MDLVTVVLQAPNLPLLQHTMSHQQLEEAPMDICHGTRSSRTALHVGGAEKEESPSPACTRAVVGGSTLVCVDKQTLLQLSELGSLC